MAKAGEFSLIERYFAPLAKGVTGALELKDDAGYLTPNPSMDLVVTKDALVEGVHFLPSDPADQVAQKLLRVNLSDLAAKGAKPLHYLLACAWPGDISEEWIADFARGLAEDQDRFGVTLLGGDTVSTDGPKVFSLTAFGECRKGTMIRRAGAKVGDLVCVSGTIGDAGLGLLIGQGKLSLSSQTDQYLTDRYRLPQPRLVLGQRLVGVASACVDISDGLLADCEHLADVSGVRAQINAEDIPISPQASEALKRGLCDLSDLACSGDDYELCFTVAPEGLDALGDLIAAGEVRVIGEVLPGSGVVMVDKGGAEIVMKTKGYQHF